MSNFNNFSGMSSIGTRSNNSSRPPSRLLSVYTYRCGYCGKKKTYKTEETESGMVRPRIRCECQLDEYGRPKMHRKWRLIEQESNNEFPPFLEEAPSLNESEKIPQQILDLELNNVFPNNPLDNEFVLKKKDEYSPNDHLENAFILEKNEEYSPNDYEFCKKCKKPFSKEFGLLPYHEKDCKDKCPPGAKWNRAPMAPKQKISNKSLRRNGTQRNKNQVSKKRTRSGQIPQIYEQKIYNYRCGYCGRVKSSSSLASDGRVRIRCECGAGRYDKKPRMHAKWRILVE